MYDNPVCSVSVHAGVVLLILGWREGQTCALENFLKTTPHFYKINHSDFFSKP